MLYARSLRGSIFIFPHSLPQRQHSAKFLALRQLLGECGLGSDDDAAGADDEENHRHRVLLFAQSKDMLNLIESDVLTVGFGLSVCK